MKVEIRADNTALITGYVNVVGRLSRVLRDVSGSFVEMVKPTTFARALEAAKSVGLMFDHARIIGSTDNVLELKEDSIGLYAKAVVSDPEIIEKAKKNELRGWSFGFYINDSGEEWSQTSDGMRLRTLTDIELIEVSILDVTPAYIATSIEMRDGNNVLKEYRNADAVVEITDNSEPPIKVESKDTIDMALLKRKFETLKLG